MENVKNVNEYNNSQLKIKQEIRETIGKNNNSNVNEKSDDEKIREAREKYYKKNSKKEGEKKQEEESLKKLRVNEPEGFELNTEKAMRLKREKKLKELAKNLEKMGVKFKSEGKKRLPGAPSEINGLKKGINFYNKCLLCDAEQLGKYIDEIEIESSNEKGEILKYKNYGEAAKVLNELMEKCKKMVELSIKDLDDLVDDLGINIEYDYYKDDIDERFKYIRKFMYAYERLLQEHSEILLTVLNLIKNNLSYDSTKRNSKDLGFFGDLLNIYYENYIKIYKDFSNYIPTVIYKDFSNYIPIVFKEDWFSFYETIKIIKKWEGLKNKISSINKKTINEATLSNLEVKYENKKYNVLEEYKKYGEAAKVLNELMEKCKYVKKSENEYYDDYSRILQEHLTVLEKLCKIINSNEEFNSNEEYYFSKLKSKNLGSFADLFNVYYKSCINLYENFLKGLPPKKTDLILEEDWNYFNEKIEYEKYLDYISTKINLDLNDKEKLKDEKEKLKSFNGLKADYKKGLITEHFNIINKCVDLAENQRFYSKKLKAYLQERKEKIDFLVKMLKQNNYDIKKEKKFNFNIYKKNLEFNSVAEIFKYVNVLHGTVIEKLRILKEELKKEEEELKRNPEDTLIKSDKLIKSAELVFRVLFIEILKKECRYLDVLSKIKTKMIKSKDAGDIFTDEKIFREDFENVFIKYSMLNIVNLYENFLTYDPIKYPNEFSEYSKELLEKPE